MLISTMQTVIIFRLPLLGFRTWCKDAGMFCRAPSRSSHRPRHIAIDLSQCFSVNYFECNCGDSGFGDFMDRHSKALWDQMWEAFPSTNRNTNWWNSHHRFWYPVLCYEPADPPGKAIRFGQNRSLFTSSLSLFSSLGSHRTLAKTNWWAHKCDRRQQDWA